MRQATLTSKGQITIPKYVRESLALKVGDKIEFVLTESKEVIMRPVTKTVDEVYGRLFKPERAAVTVDEMDALLKRKISRGFK
jgi:AbrB family looped-hinge helix DNA binding protein